MSLSIQLITFAIFSLRIEYKHSLLGTRSQWNRTYEYIVVGAGSAGAVVTNRLTEIPNINVLLLEAGRTQSVLNDIPANWVNLPWSEFDWNYTDVRQLYYGLVFNGIVPETRGKVIGGTSSINTMIYNRGNRRDYDSWVTQYGAKGWSYDEVLPYFIKSENNSDINIVLQNPGFHGTRGPLQVSSDPNPQPILLVNQKVLNEFGFETIDVNGAKQLGTGIGQSTINPNNGFRSGTGNAYIDPNPHPNNLHILTDALVIKVLIDKSNDNLKAFGVIFVKNNKTYEVRANKENYFCRYFEI